MNKFNGEPSQWNMIIAGLPNAHLLQSWEWAAFKAKYGWQPLPFVWDAPNPNSTGNTQVLAAAIILKRIIPIKGFSARLPLLYIPRGPLLNWNDRELRQWVLDDLLSYAKKQHALFIKIDPYLILGSGIPNSTDQQDNKIGQEIIKELETRNWHFSNDQIQYRNTVIIDLSFSEDVIKSRFKQKTRYNINLAIRKGITVRRGKLEDLPLLFKMYAKTSIRDGFIIREEEYYRTVWHSFMTIPRTASTPFAVPLIAEFAGEPIAAIFVFGFSSRAYYLYGMSSDNHREKMPNYLLQWEAIKLAKELECLEYDLWGAPDEFIDTDPMWGVFRFKEGLGGSVIRTIGAWDYPVNRFVYKIYAQILPRLLNIMRSQGRHQTKRVLMN